MLRDYSLTKKVFGMLYLDFRYLMTDRCLI